MDYRYIQEKLLIDKSEDEKNIDLIKNIIKTREELKNANNNFEFASGDLIDFYSYQIKANQSMLDYLMKLAKEKGLQVDMINDIKYSMIEEAG